MLIVLGEGSLAKYPEGGGHWTWFLQYPLGLRALGHDVFWFEVLPSTGDDDKDQRLIKIFFERATQYGLAESCALLVLNEGDTEPLENGTAYGKTKERIKEIVRSADVLWNFCCAFRGSLLSLFRRRVLIDVDPGHLQVSALQCEDMGIHDHDAFLTVGGKLHDPDCEVPTLELTWHRFDPFVYLPMWEVTPDPGPLAPFTSVTQWTWEELWLDGRVLSVSKRSAYLKYARLPQLARRPFELAVNIGQNDITNDRELLRSCGWKVADPHEVTGSPSSYQQYIAGSRAEILCPKPIYRELKTGWFSDRSVCYLASGRPVIAEDTGFSERIPVGNGLLAFHNIEEAAAAVADIDSNYARHSRAARELAEEFFNYRRCLDVMLAASS